MRWLLGVAFALCLALPASAGSIDDPELVDAAGDQTLENAPAGIAWGAGADLLGVWFTDDQEGLAAHIHMADVKDLQSEPSNPESDAIVAAMFRLDHADKGGAAGRDGEWTLRADWHGTWTFWGEGPCLDGKDSDGCAGEDRDIHDPLSGSVDEGTSTVTVVVPWDLLGPIQHGDGIVELMATTQDVYPAWPLYTTDWDTDQASAEYRYTWPVAPAQVVDSSAKETPASSSAGPSHGTPPASATKPPSSGTDPPPAGAAAAGQADGSAGQAPAAPAARASAPAAALLVLGLLLLSFVARRGGRGDRGSM